MTTPTARSAASSSHAGSSDLNAIIGSPTSTRQSAWPSPHHAPRRAARRASPSSAATSEVTATRWSGSDAWRSPRMNAIASATSSGAPSSRPVSQASACSSGWKRESKLMPPPPPPPARTRCRRRWAGAAPARARGAPPPRAGRASTVSSRRFWKTPPDSTTSSSVHASAVARATALWKRAETTAGSTPRPRSSATASTVGRASSPGISYAPRSPGSASASSSAAAWPS